MTRPDADLTPGDYAFGLLSGTAIALLMGPVLAWFLTPPTPPAQSYCFRADPPPCQMTVRP